MKATTWKAVFAAISPSPVFQAIAEFAKLRADQRLFPVSSHETERHD
jgi:hypothetical protein